MDDVILHAPPKILILQRNGGSATSRDPPVKGRLAPDLTGKRAGRARSRRNHNDRGILLIVRGFSRGWPVSVYRYQPEYTNLVV